MYELFMMDWCMKGAGRFPTKNKDSCSDVNSAECDHFYYGKNRMLLGRMHFDHVKRD